MTCLLFSKILCFKTNCIQNQDCHQCIWCFSCLIHCVCFVLFFTIFIQLHMKDNSIPLRSLIPVNWITEPEQSIYVHCRDIREGGYAGLTWSLKSHPPHEPFWSPMESCSSQAIWYFWTPALPPSFSKVFYPLSICRYWYVAHQF